MRNDPATLQNLANKHMTVVTKQEGDACAAEIKAVKYLECSALTQEGVCFLPHLLVCLWAQSPHDFD